MPNEVAVLQGGGGELRRDAAAATRRAIHLGAAAMRVGRVAVEAAWEAGRLLIAAKEQTRHGDWLPWLEAEGLPGRTVRRWMLLARENPDIGQLVQYRSVGQALKAIAAVPDAGKLEPAGTSASREAAAAALGVHPGAVSVSGSSTPASGAVSRYQTYTGFHEWFTPPILWI